jgi:transcriptional regulator with XRE-family HTH domain
MEAIEEMREDKGMSQRELSRQAGLGPTTYWNMRQHPERIFAHNLLRLAECVGIGVDFIIPMKEKARRF